ncbi:MAG: CpsD/CapB family tyrosine-protein kinase [Atopobiaceae bacterium]|nr:CpsD/CapB family tyrosine-protein kinase [Atopobiaceae bacterium]
MALLNKLGKQRKDERSSVVNSAKTLLANIRFMDVDNPVKTMAITSAVPNEGKTFVAANLASAIATSGKSCLLVECDMRRRSMSRALGVHAQHGIYSVMAGECTIQEAAVETPTHNLFFLDSEPRIPNPSDLLNSNRFSRFVDLARNTYDYVLFDTPPVGTFVDAAVLGTKVDAVFMVVRENFTRKAEVAAAADQLKKSGCNLAGMIMNYCERTSSEYYYEYYYTHDDKKATEAKSAPKMPVPKQRPSRQSEARTVPSAPPERPARAKTSHTVNDDTGTYERLADEIAQAQARRTQSDVDEF